MRKVKSTMAASQNEEDKYEDSDESVSLQSHGSLSDVLGPRRDAFNNSLTIENDGQGSPIKPADTPNAKNRVSKSFGTEQRSDEVNSDTEIIIPKRKGTGTFGGNIETEGIKQIQRQTFAGKKSKMFFYTQREIVLFTDGSFAYKAKNKSEKIKMTITRDSIKKVERKNQVLTITYNGDNKLAFKFSRVQEAASWYNSMKK